MKRITFSFFTMLAIILFATTLWGQEKKNSFVISGDFCHYWPIEESKLSYFPGYYRPLFNPGIELTYSKKLFENSNLGFGLNYQFGKFGARVGYVGRFKLEELSIPIVYTRYISLFGIKRFVLSTGMYNGILLKYSAESAGSAIWYIRPPEYITNLSSDKFFTDLFIDFGFNLLKGNIGDLTVAPFFKIRINGTWLNYYYRNFNGGFRIKYSFDF